MMDLRAQTFGVEIEMTGITRSKAAKRGKNFLIGIVVCVCLLLLYARKSAGFRSLI